jgi:hypothetical protein
MLVCFGLRQQISNSFVVDFGVTDTDCYSLIEFHGTQVVNLVDSSWEDTAILENSGWACHRVCLPSTGLAVTKHSTVVAFHNRADHIVSGRLINLILACIVQDPFELKLPAVCLIVHMTIFSPLLCIQIYRAFSRVDFVDFGCEIACRPRPDNYAYRLLDHF